MLQKLFGLDPAQHKVRTEIYAGIPAFVTMIMMPLSYSISDGIMLGLIMYVLMKVGSGKKGIRRIGPTVWVLFVIFVLRYIQQSL